MNDNQSLPPQNTEAQPVPPVVVAAPAPAAPVAVKPSKNLIIAAIAGGVVILVGIIAAALLLAGPTKQDYVKASSDTSDAISAYNDMGAVYISSSSTSAEVANGLSQIKTSRDKFESRFTSLGSLKAVSKDGDISKLYQAAKDKKQKFDTAMVATIEAYDKIMPIVIEINSNESASDLTSYGSMAASLRTKLQALSLTSQVNKDYVSSLVRDIQKLETLIPIVQAGKQDYKKYDSAAVSEFYDTISSLSKDDRDWSSNVQKLGKDGNMKDELNKLETALYDKSVK